MTEPRVNPNCRLEDQGITGLGNVHYNLLEPALIDAAIQRGEGKLGLGGTFLVSTGAHTGRSPKDKHVVRTPAVEDSIWWENNRPMEPEAFDRLHADMLEHMKGKDYFVQDLYGGADPALRLDVRVVTELAWHGSSSAICCAVPKRPNWPVSCRNSPSSTAPRSRPTRHATAAARRR